MNQGAALFMDGIGRIESIAMSHHHEPKQKIPPATTWPELFIVPPGLDAVFIIVQAFDSTQTQASPPPAAAAATTVQKLPCGGKATEPARPNASCPAANSGEEGAF